MTPEPVVARGIDGNMRATRLLLALPLLCLLAACGTVTSSWPLHRGQSALALSAGGPVVNIGGLQAPIPYAVTRYRYGVTDKLGLYAGGHLLMAAFGVAGADAGATWHFVDQHGWWPSLGVGAGGIGYVEFDGGGQSVFFPAAELTASYMRDTTSISYGGVHTMAQFTPRFHMTYSPYIGQEMRISRRFSANVEVRWYGGWERTTPRAVVFTMPIANHGAIGFAAGINYHFGGWYE
jgi:hypothetical protein